jgi:glutamyl endopeptidase
MISRIASLQQKALVSSLPIKEAIINDPDGRVKVNNPNQFPWSIHGYMEMIYGNKVYQGTGILVNHSHVLTAGHCLYSEQDGVPDHVNFYPGRDGNRIFWSSTAKQVIVHPGWYKNQDESSDIGMIVLNNSQVGYQTGWATTKVFNNDELKNSLINVTGYPSDKRIESGVPYMYTMNGSVKTIKIGKFYYHIDTFGGQSGSGVWLADEELINCFGIHVTGCKEEGNGAVRITSDIYKKIGRWINSSTPEQN